MSLVTSDTQHWIHSICRRVSNLLGWPLRFVPVEAEQFAEIDWRLRHQPESLWSAEVHNGQQRTGLLYIDLPDDCTADRSFPTVCGVGDVLAELLGAVASTTCSLESRTREVSALVDLSRTLPAEDGLLDALDRLLRGMVQLSGFRGAAFFLLHPAARRLQLRGVHALEPLQVPFPQRDLRHAPADLDALTHGRVVLHRETAAERREWLPPGVSTAVCLPVPSEAGPLGTLWAFDRRHRLPSDREFHVLGSIAVQLAATLERAVLLRESATQHRLRRDLRAASECQTRDAAAALPPDIGFEAAALCTSRFELGGDLCELIPVAPGRTVVALGDAAGDSVPAAMVMASVRGALHSLLQTPGACDVAATDHLMERLNRTLYGITPAHLFMSLLCGTIDTEAMTFTYTNAGHPTPLLARDGQIVTLESHGLLLGVCDDATYGRSVLPLCPGDWLVMFSDGVTEAMSHGRKMFRSDGIREVMAYGGHTTPRELLEAIWSRLEIHTHGGSEPDDRTLLVLRMT